MQVLDTIKKTKHKPVSNTHSSFQSECATNSWYILLCPKFFSRWRAAPCSSWRRHKTWDEMKVGGFAANGDCLKYESWIGLSKGEFVKYSNDKSDSNPRKYDVVYSFISLWPLIAVVAQLFNYFLTLKHYFRSTNSSTINLVFTI